MSLNGYDSAYEQATNERAEIRVEIERLLNRGKMLDKLLECLAPFVSTPPPAEGAGEPAAAAETKTEAAQETAETQGAQEEQHKQLEAEPQEQPQG